jgi:hypothetical protein
MKSLILVAVAALLSGTAHAEKWSGTGAEYSPAGKQLSTYQISVENTQSAANVVVSVATITAADGSQKSLTQTLTMNGSEWKDVSNLGQGGGACYSSDTCGNYISGANGMAYATTIISDGPNARRELTTVLQNGQAVKVLRETLSRVN